MGKWGLGLSLILFEPTTSRQAPHCVLLQARDRPPQNQRYDKSNLYTRYPMTLLNLVKIPVTSVDLSPGSHLLINNVTWEQYEALLADLGEERQIPRINYCNGTLELMSPLPAHERPHRIIADIVKALLDSQQRE